MQDNALSHPTHHRESITGEIVLASAKRVPVQIVGFEQVIPTPEARVSGSWQPGEEFFSIRDIDLTPEQARQARYFVRPYSPGVVGVMRSEEA